MLYQSLSCQPLRSKRKQDDDVWHTLEYKHAKVCSFTLERNPNCDGEIDWLQRRAAVPASKKLGAVKYLDAAYGSALELERAQTR